jgi:hypothetical protein
MFVVMALLKLIFNFNWGLVKCKQGGETASLRRVAPSSVLR